MKVIDLLNKIANGEIYIGTRVIYREKVFIFTGSCLENIKENSAIAMFALDNLNEEVEVIEEDKEIKKLQYSKLEVCPDLEDLLEFINESREEFRQKINEIIDFIKENK